MENNVSIPDAALCQFCKGTHRRLARAANNKDWTYVRCWDCAPLRDICLEVLSRTPRPTS